MNTAEKTRTDYEAPVMTSTEHGCDSTHFANRRKIDEQMNAMRRALVENSYDPRISSDI